jgi:7-cyano-7-deazaguanine reductase
MLKNYPPPFASLNDSPLGKETSYASQYDPTLLFPIPRKSKRDEIGVNEQQMPFDGTDIWNAYEISWLNLNGKPMIAIGEISVLCTTPNLVESKSIKLYLNSFNQSQFSTLEEVKSVMEKDLSKAAKGLVTVKLTLPKTWPNWTVDLFQGTCLDDLDIQTDIYETHPAFLTCETENHQTEEWLYSDLLKSNCLITNQPDWGSVLIHYKGQKISHEGLLKYFISFRTHNEFHEQCIERIYMDIMKHCHPEKLMVYGRYTRRGGLDINPCRSNYGYIPENIRLGRQ